MASTSGVSRCRSPVFPGAPGIPYRHLTARIGQRQRVRGADARDARNRGDRPLDAFIEPHDVKSSREELGRSRHAHCQDTVCGEARIRTEHVTETAKHESAAGEQYERQRHLRDDQPAPHPTVTPTTTHRAACKQRGQRRPGYPGCGTDRGHNAEQHTKTDERGSNAQRLCATPFARTGQSRSANALRKSPGVSNRCFLTGAPAVCCGGAIVEAAGTARPSSPWWKSRRSAETGEAPRSQGATTENIEQYLMEEQRSERGCIAGRMPPRLPPRTASWLDRLNCWQMSGSSPVKTARLAKRGKANTADSRGGLRQPR
jgi:hypothetical protein